MTRVLLLNASWQVLDTISIKKAVSLLLRHKVEEVEGVAKELRTPSSTFSVPSVLRLKRYVQVPVRGLSWSKYRVLKRDSWTCIFCGGADLPSNEYTVDHLIPTSKGGKSTWSNTACACLSCNQRKADRTPNQAGMKLLWEPKTPRTNYLVISGSYPSEWKKYLGY